VLGVARWLTARPADAAATRNLLDRYCTECHNDAELAGNLAIEPANLAAAAAEPEHWEKLVRKLRAEAMPPEGPRPGHSAYVRAAAYLEAELDAAAAANPNPGDVRTSLEQLREPTNERVRETLDQLRERTQSLDPLIEPTRTGPAPRN
jgi:mono/diheme cytochrome c family protein